MAHIRKLAKDRWQARYIDPTGRERAKNFPREADAKAFLAGTEEAKLRGGWVDPRLAKVPLREWAERWMGTVVHLKPKTRVGYESLLRNHVLPAFGTVAIGRVEQLDVRDWVAGLMERGLSPSRIRQAYQLLSSMLKAAVASGYLVRTPCIGIKLPRAGKREVRLLTAEEVERLAQATAPSYGTLVYLLAYGGLRWGEAAALRRGRCNLLRSRVEVVESLAEAGGGLYFGPTKTYQARSVVIPAFLRDLLADHLARHVPPDPEALVFTAGNGAPLRNSNFRRRVWHRALDAAGLPRGIRIHDLRHTCAALLVAQQAHPLAVMQHLGHSAITVTMDIYGHLFPDEKERIAESLDAAWRAARGDPETDFRRTPDGLGEAEGTPLRGERGS